MNFDTQVEIAGSDAGFEEDREGDAVGGEAVLGHEIDGGDCSVDLAGIG